jgi:hypothetical protein
MPQWSRGCPDKPPKWEVVSSELGGHQMAKSLLNAFCALPASIPDSAVFVSAPSVVHMDSGKGAAVQDIQQDCSYKDTFSKDKRAFRLGRK